MPSVSCDCVGTCENNSCVCKRNKRKCNKSCHLTHSTKCKHKRKQTKKRPSRKNRKSRKL